MTSLCFSIGKNCVKAIIASSLSSQRRVWACTCEAVRETLLMGGGRDRSPSRLFFVLSAAILTADPRPV
jgi:hypothetical protein